MARIFYWTDTGNIYGVHPSELCDGVVTLDGASKNIVIPEGVTWLNVAETPDRIAWPGGGEQYSRVDSATLTLQARTDTQRPARGLAFARVIHHSLTGADAEARWNRGLTLRRKEPAIVGLFINDLRLAGNAARLGALAAIQSSWAAVTSARTIGLRGSDPEHLTQAEAERIEVAARAHGITLP